MTHDISPAALKRAQYSVYAAFLANGFVVGHWASKIPVMVMRLGISEATLGYMIISFGLGAILALIIGAWLVNRFGSADIVRWSSLMLAPALVLLSLAPTVFTAVFAMVWLGMSMGAMDNAMNANGVAVEVALDRPVMSTYHGFWSLGGVIGGVTGGAMIVWFGELGHAVLVMCMVLALSLWAWSGYMSDAHTDAAFQASQPDDKAASQAFSLPRNWGIYVLGVLTMLSFTSEGAVIDWSALFLKNDLSAPVIVSGYAVAAFSAAMALMRFLGDNVRKRLGDRQTFVVSAALSAIGLLLAGISSNFYGACVGFLIAGIGMANVAPILFSAAGKFPGVRPSIGIAIISTFGYGGFMFLPALAGIVAQYYSIRVVYIGWSMVVLMVAVVGLFLPNIGDKKAN